MKNKIYNKSIKNTGIKIIPFAEFNKIENLIKWINLYRAKKHDYKKYPNKIIKFGNYLGALKFTGIGGY